MLQYMWVNEAMEFYALVLKVNTFEQFASMLHVYVVKSSSKKLLLCFAAQHGLLHF